MSSVRGRARSVRARLVIVALLTVVSAVGLSGISGADPTRDRLDRARAALGALNERLPSLVEDYNAARIELERSRDRLAAARVDAERAAVDASQAQELLSERVATAYQGAGTSLDVLLGSTSYTEFTDRLTFLAQTAQDDADALARARSAGEEARRAGEHLAAAVGEQRGRVRALEALEARIRAGIAEQEALVAQLQEQLEREAAERARRAREAALRAEQLRQQQAATQASEAQGQSGTNDGSGSGSGGGDDPAPPPPPPSGRGAAAAIAAARSVLGTPYRWGGDSPSEGFDCSGLTSWAWGRAGVSLPHSSAAQYSATPRVSRGDLRPGDLLFFYSPIHHVALYIGGNQMIHARHPGTVVEIDAIADYWWNIYVGAGRPG